MFCFHKELQCKNRINSLRFTEVLNIFRGFQKSQKDIENFISKCKESRRRGSYPEIFDLSFNKNINFLQVRL